MSSFVPRLMRPRSLAARGIIPRALYVSPIGLRSIHNSASTPAQPAYATSTTTYDPPASQMNDNTPARTSAQWADFGRDHIAHGLGRLRDFVVNKGEGMYLYSTDGKKFMDFTAGIGVVNLGHCHPQVTAAAAAQVGQLVHMQCSIMFSEPYLQLIERLLPAMPHPSLDSFFFWNSGSEAVEASIKLARQATGKQNIVCFQGGYHGRTMGSGAVTRSKPIYTQGTNPLMSGVQVAAFPYWHGLGVPPSTSEEEICKIAEHHLDMLFRQQVAPKDTAAILIEPVQGEGGYVQCPPAFLKHLRKICDKHNILLIVDEVQTGFFRTGKYFSISQIPDFRPDVLIFAKGVANGFPLSGIVSSKELMGKMDVGSLGGTYAGNAVSCAAGVAAQEAYQNEGIEENVAARTEQLRGALHALQKSDKTKHLIVDVRGQGLMTAIEFRSGDDPLTTMDLPPNTKIPKDIGKRVQQYCVDHGLLLLTTSCFDTIRFIPPLIVSEGEMAQAMKIFSDAVQAVAKEG